ncbi:MAG TPA: glycosyltransferase [Polyangia bacterium]|nr:glycosyltransferase [Polyangia bacterium]
MTPELIYTRRAAPPRAILFVIDELEVGGSQRQVLVLARAFLEAGHAVTVAYFRPDNAEMQATFEAAGARVELVAKRGGLDPGFLVRLGRFLGDDPTRLVLTFGYSASLWARLAGWPAGAPRSVTCIRNLTFLPRSTGPVAAAMKAAERALAARSRWVVANSRATADAMIARGIVARDKMLVIPNAVEPAAHAPREEARARLAALIGGADPGPIIGTLARLVDVKDLPTLVRAARHVVDAVPGARFVLGGEGPERAALERLRAELGLAANVHLPGTLAARDVISGFDVAVLTSLREGMPNFVVESMAAGVPLVSTRAGAAPELLDDGALGHLAAVGDWRAIADAILATLRAPAESRARATRAAAKLADMTPAKIAARYLSLFDPAPAPRERAG